MPSWKTPAESKGCMHPMVMPTEPVRQGGVSDGWWGPKETQAGVRSHRGRGGSSTRRAPVGAPPPGSGAHLRTSCPASALVCTCQGVFHRASGECPQEEWPRRVAAAALRRGWPPGACLGAGDAPEGLQVHRVLRVLVDRRLGAAVGRAQTSRVTCLQGGCGASDASSGARRHAPWLATVCRRGVWGMDAQGARRGGDKCARCRN